MKNFVPTPSLKLRLFILILLIFQSCFFLPAQDEIRFTHLTLDGGLSQNSGYCFIQDSQGFMWIGTQDGLNRYDGRNMVVYKYESSDPSSISDNFIVCLFEDIDGNLWVGTRSGGLNKYNRKKDSFSAIKKGPQDAGGFSNNNVTAIAGSTDPDILWIGTGDGRIHRFHRGTNEIEGFRLFPEETKNSSPHRITGIVRDGFLYISTQGAGLKRFDPRGGEYLEFTQQDNSPESLRDNTINTMAPAADGKLWIGTNKGLDLYNPANGMFKHYPTETGAKRGLSHPTVWSLQTEDENVLWVGTFGGGLNKLDLTTGEFSAYRHNGADPHSLSHDSVSALYIDKAGTLWVGTPGSGINLYSYHTQKFTHFHRRPDKPEGLSENIVMGFFEDSRGILWIATLGGGLNAYDKSTGIFTHYRNDRNNPNSIGSDRVWCVFEDSRQTLWVGTIGGGLNRFNRKTGTFTRYMANPKESNTISHNMVFEIVENSDGKLLIGTFAGLDILDPESETFSHKYAGPEDLSHNFIKELYIDEEDIVWIGTDGGGLNKFDPETNTVTVYKNDPDNPNSISNDRIKSIHQDKEGILWIGTSIGLNRFDPASETFRAYTMSDGLPNDVVYGILADDTGRLWLSTNRGLSRFNPIEETFKNYDERDGLQSNEFAQGSCYKSGDGKLFFGGINGLNSFYPRDIKENRTVPPVVLTDFRIFNKKVPITEEPPLTESICTIEEIILSWEDRIFSFEFAALGFIMPEKNMFAYKMEGVDKDWVFSGKRNSATYTNLNPGRYVFKVKAANNDGFWNEEGYSVGLRIIPPWWRTTWFRVLLICITAGVLFTGYRWRIAAMRQQQRRLESDVARRTQQLAELNENLRQEIAERVQIGDQLRATLKDKEFLMQELNHRVKNNLTLITSLISLKSSKDNDEPYLKDIQNQIDAIRIVHEQLYTREDVSSINLRDYFPDLLNTIFSSFTKLPVTIESDIQNISLKTGKAVSLGLILNEIATNAIKHGFEPGLEARFTVKMKKEENTGRYILIISNTGNLFPEDVELSKTDTMGMQLIYVLVEQLNGSVELQRAPVTTYIITFPAEEASG